MIRKLYTFESGSFDPYGNLAAEQMLLEGTEPGTCTLYLWQNRNTVVIGRNQNAWKECRTSLLREEGGHLARRLSGGGAVFHDLGNLNFTFLVSEEDYDVRKQLSVILLACRELGIPAEISGRNDLTADGRKFSGSAFYRSGGKAYHHGTLLIGADMEKLGRYLSPSREKLESKGVSSVRARVVNLKEFRPGLECREMKQKLKEAFQSVYGSVPESLPEDIPDREAFRKLRERNAGWEWVYGSRMPFSFACERRFGWGDIQLQLRTENGIIREARAWSDAMDWRTVQDVGKVLAGCRFSLREMEQRIEEGIGDTDIGRDICRMLEEEEI